ncbi:MAG TPA: mannonate dehydratase [Thermomicrobiales bacterium]|nr:mannonate dehydratase [Thermomicrobiales bacterium]
MRIGVGVPGAPTDEQLTLARQMGCSGVVVATPAIPWTDGWAYDDLARLRERIESFDLRVEAIQNSPLDEFDQIRLGLPGRAAALANYQNTVRNVGRAGIPVLAYNWRPNRLYRTGTAPGRGGARVTAFDAAQAVDVPLSHGRAYSAEELWATHDEFLRQVVPVAVEAGVTLALHPDDPPGGAIGGVTRIMSSFEGFARAAATADAIAPTGWGLLFCVGCWAEMGGTANVLRGIHHFGPRGQISYVHFRDVQGTAECFQECFPGEGTVNVTAVLRALREVGFTGVIIDDHAPLMVGDEGWAPKSRAYQTGYLQGLLRAVEDMSRAVGQSGSRAVGSE